MNSRRPPLTRLWSILACTVSGTISGLIAAHITPAAAMETAPIASIPIETPATAPAILRVQTFMQSRPTDKLETLVELEAAAPIEPTPIEPTPIEPTQIEPTQIVMKTIPEEMDVDTELGNLQIRQQAGNPPNTPPRLPEAILPEKILPEKILPIEAGDSDLGNLRVKPEAEDEDDDLGGLKTRPSVPAPVPPAPVPPPKPKWLSVTAWFNQISNSNAFSATDYKFDRAIRSGVTLSAIPALGPKTYLIGGVDGVITRYNKFPIKYDELRLRLGIWQQLTPRSYGEIGWSNQKLYLAKDGLRNVLSGEQFIDENTIRLDLGRTDPLTKSLSLSSLYQFRQILSDREDKNRSNHNLSTSLNYRLSPNWNAGLDYYLSWAHYTNINRDDIYQSLQLRTSYAISPRVQTNLFGGFNFGGSTEDSTNLGFGASGREKLQYDGWFFGLGVSFNTPLF
jgi:hypothetical protein